jgi:hypothetical protein
MRIDSAGNVGIGTTSPATRLVLAGNNDALVETNTLRFWDTDTATEANQQIGKIEFFSSDASVPGAGVKAYIGAFAEDTTPDVYLSFATDTSTGTATERMRIDSAGNVGIGTSAPAAKLQVNAAEAFRAVATDPFITFYGADGTTRLGFLQMRTGDTTRFQVDAAQPITFANNATERARIDSSGNLLIGRTSFGGTATGIDLGGSGFVGSYSPDTTNSTTTFAAYSNGASAYRFYVGWGGTVFATSTTISAISDQRLKENVQDLDVGLDKIMALKPRKFDWKAGKGKDIKNDRGWIAQEFEQVFPDMVDEWRDPSPEGEEPYKSVRADLIPVLVKAMQEQQAIINDLKARLDAANL